jgi:hypothetical protein
VLSLSIEIDNTAVVNELAYDWVFGFHPDQLASSAPQGRIKHRHGKRAKASTIAAARYWPSMPSRILRIQPPAVVDFSADSKVQTWLKFNALVAQWRAERGATSSITAMAMCDAYQKIIGLGPDAVPLIIAQMQSEADEPDQWFWALRVLTGVDPVADEDRGDFLKMSQSWISWAENAGYVW